jgi:hypothetical protein
MERSLLYIKPYYVGNDLEECFFRQAGPSRFVWDCFGYVFEQITYGHRSVRTHSA